MTVPTVSVVIPTYNRPDALKTCLDAIVRMSLQPDEIIVVDDGGDVDLSKITSRYSIKLISQNNSGPAAARNNGVSVATGDYIAFIDDDTYPASDWLDKLIKATVVHPHSIIGGHTHNSLINNPYATTSQLIVDMAYEVHSPGSLTAFFTSNNMLIPTKNLRDIGGFNPEMRFSEDRELCLRWQQHGHTLNYVPDAVMYHAHDLSLWSFIKQHFYYGKGAYQYHQYFKQTQVNLSSPLDHRMSLQVWYWLSYPLRHLNGWVKLQVMILLVVWQMANLLGYLWMAWQERQASYD